MPTVGRRWVLGSGDSMELLETAAMTGGARVRARLVFTPGGLRVQPHLHLDQDEVYEVQSGRLAYMLDGKAGVAEAGATVTLPRGVAHQHYCGGAEDTVVIQTVTPGHDFDYLIENIFGLGSEGRAIGGLDNAIQGLVWIHGMRSTLFVASLPIGLQKLLASVAAPFARWVGYRAVHRRFSGEER